jgi:hypothetical protein
MCDEEVDRIDDEIIVINERLDNLSEALKSTVDYMKGNQLQHEEKQTEIDALGVILNLLVGTLALNVPQFSNEFAEELEGLSEETHLYFQTHNYGDNQIKIFNAYIESYRKLLLGVASIKQERTSK